MNQFYDKMVFLSDDIPQEQKELMLYLARREAEILETVCVVYRPDCGCEYDTFLQLVRYPMSKKCHHLCEHCGKGTLLSISDPITFYCPWNKQDLSLEELKDMHISESRQRPYLEKYKELSMEKNMHNKN